MQRVSSGPVQRPPQSPATVVDGSNSQQQNMHGRCKQRPADRPVVVAAAKYASYCCASFAETSARKGILETFHGKCRRTSGKKTRPYRTGKRGTKFLHGRTAPAMQRFRSRRLARAAQAREPRHQRRGGHPGRCLAKCQDFGIAAPSGVRHCGRERRGGQAAGRVRPPLVPSTPLPPPP